jgi:MYXO-CTERM domain-containing protein
MAAATAAASPRDRLRVLAGMAGAAFLDLDKPSLVFFGFSPFPAAVDRLHGRVQREAPHRMRQEVIVGLLGAAGVAALTARVRRRS